MKSPNGNVNFHGNHLFVKRKSKFVRFVKPCYYDLRFPLLSIPENSRSILQSFVSDIIRQMLADMHLFVQSKLLVEMRTL